VADPDLVIAHVPASCRACEDDLADAEMVDTESRQVFDSSEIHLFVTEHLAERRRCRCGSMTKASFPAAAAAPACYGPGVRALACNVTVHQHLPFDRMTELFVDVLGCEVSVGARTTMVTEGAHSTALFT
jgi:transposase